ncbi:hypothetical protein LP7551_00129 [Roseibium album]|nr:hypothetical protein LP7551_00129 [Roseibium album]
MGRVPRPPELTAVSAVALYGPDRGGLANIAHGFTKASASYFLGHNAGPLRNDFNGLLSRLCRPIPELFIQLAN